MDSLESERRTNEELKLKLEEMVDEINNEKEMERTKDLEI